MSRTFVGYKCNGYTWLELLGEGAVGSVYKAMDEEGNFVAIKTIGPLSNVHRKREFEREVTSLRSLEGCSLVVQLQESFVFKNYGMIVMEQMEMDLLNYIEDKSSSMNDNLSHASNKVICKQIVDCVYHLHSNNIAHLDIKPENVFMNDIYSIKFGDFGSSFSWQNEEDGFAVGFIGTAFYCAPEVKTKRQFDVKKADIWSLGVLLHVVVTGCWPYSGINEEEMRLNIKNGHINLSAFNGVKSVEDLLLKTLLSSMLQKDPHVRCDIDYVVHSPWFEETRKVVSRKLANSKNYLSLSSSSSSSPDIHQPIIDVNLEPKLPKGFVEQHKKRSAELPSDPIKEKVRKKKEKRRKKTVSVRMFGALTDWKRKK